MIDLAQLKAVCLRIRESSPIIHCITNYVAMEFNANALLAVGASPVMSSCKEEIDDLSVISNALVINIGCIDALQFEAMKLAADAACRMKKPWVLDPVGAGASKYRTECALHLINEFHPSVIRGNASEIMAVSGLPVQPRGVNSVNSSDEAIEAAKRLANKTGAIVSVSGSTDYITDGERIKSVTEGDPKMPMVTAMGCTATALTAAFLTVCNTPFEAASYAMELMGYAGETAAKRTEGPGTLKEIFLDALFNFSTLDSYIFSKNMLRLYLVTDRSLAKGRDLETVVSDAVEGGVTMVQLREKDASTEEFISLAKQLKKILAPKGIPLIINDRVDVALACDADGVHIGQSDMPYETARKLMGPYKIIGLSVENMDDLQRANSLDVDYIGISPVFATPTKTDTAPEFGIEGLQKATKASVHPTVGIGGMNKETAAQVIRSGADGVAVVSAIMSADNPTFAAQEIMNEIKKGMK